MNLGHIIGSQVRDAVREEPDKGFWHQLGKTSIEWVRQVYFEYDPIRFEEWATQEDERTCPICGQLDGVVWSEGQGFTPPIHDHCRCQRVYHHTEFSVRQIETWQSREVTTFSWQWKRTT